MQNKMWQYASCGTVTLFKNLSKADGWKNFFDLTKFGWLSVRKTTAWMMKARCVQVFTVIKSRADTTTSDSFSQVETVSREDIPKTLKARRRKALPPVAVSLSKNFCLRFLRQKWFLLITFSSFRRSWLRSTTMYTYKTYFLKILLVLDPLLLIWTPWTSLEI